MLGVDFGGVVDMAQDLRRMMGGDVAVVEKDHREET